MHEAALLLMVRFLLLPSTLLPCSWPGHARHMDDMLQSLASKRFGACWTPHVLLST